jgi:hypothetical protein
MEGVVMKQSQGTYASVGIAVSHFAVNTVMLTHKKFSNPWREYLVNCDLLVYLQGCIVYLQGCIVY